jgi:hypothetical protein
MFAGMAAFVVAGLWATTASSPANAGAAIIRGATKAAKGLEKIPKTLPQAAPKISNSAKALAEAAPEAKVAAAVVGVAIVEKIISELRLLGPSIRPVQAEKVVRKWLFEAAQKAANEPNSSVTFEYLSGKLTVNKSTTVAGITVTGGETNLYSLAKKVVTGCLLADVQSLATQSLECLLALFEDG